MKFSQCGKALGGTVSHVLGGKISLKMNINHHEMVSKCNLGPFMELFGKIKGTEAQ